MGNGICPPPVPAKRKIARRVRRILLSPKALRKSGGKTGIRTLGTVARSPHFECGPIDHSGIFPGAKVMHFPVGCITRPAIFLPPAGDGASILQTDKHLNRRTRQAGNGLPAGAQPRRYGNLAALLRNSISVTAEFPPRNNGRPPHTKKASRPCEREAFRQTCPRGPSWA